MNQQTTHAKPWSLAHHGYSRAPKYLTEREALNLLREGCVLCLTHTQLKSGNEYFIAPNGGAVSEAVARDIIRRSDVWAADAGLFTDHPQSWKLGPCREMKKEKP
jgi:hypothetical protein